ncbi:cyclopropane fatty acyl phospholipid synthase [Dasania marina]|uniref:cyclopropane fatty acyl phospholipid synthase n=1 Tax=Dasania marina TaxID=471499 RepID=UPI00036DF4D0|nr:cyclopropane fatty acyl phospholipid synthase [Dasania marina]
MSDVFLPRQKLAADSCKIRVEETFLQAGITANASERYAPQIHNQHFYQRLIRDGDRGLGESYMQGWWDCEALDEFIAKLISHRRRNGKGSFRLKDISPYLWAWLQPLGRASQAYQIAEHHYNLGNELYAAMLDTRMTYTCGWWDKGAQTLEQAQIDKLALICQKLQLQPGMTVLDCGCGWGSFAAYAAEHYGVTVTGVNVSVEQVQYARQRYADLPVNFILEDYRQHQGLYDRVVSVGMVEHVGPKYYPLFIQKMRSCLKPEGLFLLHSIGNNHSQFRQDWIVKYIFPQGYVPSLTQLSAAIENNFVIEDVQNLSVNYDKTLMAWFHNFDAAWPQLNKQYGESFYRMWRFYLLSCAGMFRARELQLYQLLLSPYGLADGYKR